MPFNFTPTPNPHSSGEKRAAGEVSAKQQVAKKSKLPPLGDLVAMESAPKRPGASRLAAVAPLNICVYKVTDKAGDSWSQYENVSGAKLWQLQMDHAARPSCLFNLRGTFVFLSISLSLALSLSLSRCLAFTVGRVASLVCVVVVPMLVFSRSFNEFLTEAGKDNADFPKTLDDLGKAGIRLVVADSNDPDGVGFVQWRVSFYVAGEDGSLINFCNLFDDYIVWKTKAMAKDVETHLWPHIGIDELEQAKIDELNYEHYTVHEPAQESEMPLKWTEGAPCIGKRVATCHLTAASDTLLKLIWTGNTWAFRDAITV